MDLASNGELFTYMRNEGKLEYSQAKFLAAEIASMIEHMQDKNIAHRDLKPSNLLFDNNMRLKLVDFGSGKSFKNTDLNQKENTKNDDAGKNGKELKRMNTFVGTCEYMSPEIIKGNCIKNECDYWSLGVIIYMMFAERPPFSGEFQEETLQLIEEAQVEFPDGFPELAKDLCTRLLEKDPIKRIG